MDVSKKSSPAVVLVMLILLVTQPAYSRVPRKFCSPGCFARCITSVLSPKFVTCVGACLVGLCGGRTRSLSQPSFHCSVSCVRSKCYNPGARNGNVNKKCISSCVNNCDASFAGDMY